MNCHQCTELILNHPLAELPAQQLQAIQTHGDACTRCRQALDSARALEQQLQSLPCPDLPSDLEDAIMRRVLDGHPLRPATTSLRSTARRDRRLLGPIGVGVASALAVQAYALSSGTMQIELGASLLHHVGRGLAHMPQGNSVIIGLTIGVLLLLGGLSASIEPAPRPSAGPTDTQTQ